MDTSAVAIFRELKRIAPNISFAVDWEADPGFKWDGDGPDPRDEGYVPYDVKVSATTIIHGEEYDGKEYLGGVYDKPDEKDLDVHGYLPQMLLEAVDEMMGDLPDTMAQALEAKNYLEKVLRHRYIQQNRPKKKKQDWNPRRPKMGR